MLLQPVLVNIFCPPPFPLFPSLPFLPSLLPLFSHPPSPPQVFEQEALSIDVHQMMKDELQWLGSISPPRSPCLEFQNLLAGHLRLCQALFTCEGIDKKQYGMVAMVTHIQYGCYGYTYSVWLLWLHILSATTHTHTHTQVMTLYPDCYLSICSQPLK